MDTLHLGAGAFFPMLLQATYSPVVLATRAERGVGEVEGKPAVPGMPEMPVSALLPQPCSVRKAVGGEFKKAQRTSSLYVTLG